MFTFKIVGAFVAIRGWYPPPSVTYPHLRVNITEQCRNRTSQHHCPSKGGKSTINTGYYPQYMFCHGFDAESSTSSLRCILSSSNFPPLISKNTYDITQNYANGWLWCKLQVEWNAVMKDGPMHLEKGYINTRVISRAPSERRHKTDTQKSQSSQPSAWHVNIHRLFNNIEG